MYAWISGWMDGRKEGVTRNGHIFVFRITNMFDISLFKQSEK